MFGCVEVFCKGLKEKSGGFSERLMACRPDWPLVFCARRMGWQLSAQCIAGQKMPQKCRIHLELVMQSADSCELSNTMMGQVTVKEFPFTEARCAPSGFRRVFDMREGCGFGMLDGRDRSLGAREQNKLRRPFLPMQFWIGNRPNTFGIGNSTLCFVVSSGTTWQREKEDSNG